MAAAGIAFLLAYGGGALAAKGGNLVPPDEGEETAGNNLSYPAVLIDGNSTSPDFTVNGIEEALGATYSYGCVGAETIDGFSYPNISCVHVDNGALVYESADVCEGAGGKCYGNSVDRIYWQKEVDNQWSSQITGVPSASASAPVPVRYVDWGDSIEVVSWNETSVLRVETQPFADLGQDPLAEIPVSDLQTQLGFQMWHVSGQGTDEQWGVRVRENGGQRDFPYAYRSPFAIINAGTAQLYLSKLFTTPADDATHFCPDTTSGDVAPVYPEDYDKELLLWEGANFQWTGTGWSDACNFSSVPYTIEQSVSGKFVHGYNWRMRYIPSSFSCNGYEYAKTGWWRLTYVPAKNIDGTTERMQFMDNAVTTAPAVPSSSPTDPDDLATIPGTIEEPLPVVADVTLYSPVVDAVNNLTYIDICIVKKTKSGGGGTR